VSVHIIIHIDNLNIKDRLCCTSHYYCVRMVEKRHIILVG